MPEYRDSNGNPTQGPSIAERVTRSTSPLNVPIECEKCGSNYFYTAHAEQFAGGGYGSMEFRSLTNSPIQVRVCLCGNIVPPQGAYAPGARSVQTARDAFFESIKVSKDYQDKVNASNLLDKVANSTASRQELEALRTEVDARLKALESKPAISNNTFHGDALSGGEGPAPTVNKKAPRSK